MANISLCMIVRNEEEVLARCLDSVKDLMDEIIIVDTGSTDRTKEIAIRYTDRIYDLEWTDDFAAARNYSFSLATQEYVMWLDADDFLREKDSEKLRELKQTLDPEIDSVVMEYHLAFDGYDNPIAMSRRNRIVKRSRQFTWYNPVHEYLFIEGNVYLTDIAVTHGRVHQNTKRNLHILEKIIEKNGSVEGRDVLYYANELADTDRLVEAVEQYRRFLESPVDFFEDNLMACARLSACYHQLGNYELKLQALLQSMAYDIPRADFCCSIGQCFVDKEEFSKAIYWFKQAIAQDEVPNHFGVLNLICWTWYPHFQLCICYGMEGELELAYEHNEKALKYLPDDQNLLENKNKLEQALGMGGKPG
ncbi:glycosyltransferase family 2 protein [Cohnella abietis]|uniref:Beta 1,4 glucosyltransferase n=1 Tax=Cohnella abietis TaxID=2507935 RepID=A0A3T1D8W4_9BACL|nr:glycosyltransferase family 2 protein [Cohnella abietis]BBI34514.1 beta 1,4 glucosyltransferase [Cohnella abietis]